MQQEPTRSSQVRFWLPDPGVSARNQSSTAKHLYAAVNDTAVQRCYGRRIDCAQASLLWPSADARRIFRLIVSHRQNA